LLVTATATDVTAWVWWTIAAAVVVLALLAWWVWQKGRPFSTGDVFRASRWSRGNRLFPTQVLVTSSSVVQYKPRWIGREEESIHLAHIASVRLETHALFADVLIETSGGSDPIRCHGHSKGDAARIKALIEQYQDGYYRAGGQTIVPPRPPNTPTPSSR